MGLVGRLLSQEKHSATILNFTTNSGVTKDWAKNPQKKSTGEHYNKKRQHDPEQLST